MNDTVTLSRAEHEALIERLDELEDIVALRRADARISNGDGEYLPIEMVDRLIAGENAIRVWREHRGLTTAELAAVADLSENSVRELEAGVEAGGLGELRRLARALRVDLDDLVAGERRGAA